MSEASAVPFGRVSSGTLLVPYLVRDGVRGYFVVAVTRPKQIAHVILLPNGIAVQGVPSSQWRASATLGSSIEAKWARYPPFPSQDIWHIYPALLPSPFLIFCLALGHHLQTSIQNSLLYLPFTDASPCFRASYSLLHTHIHASYHTSTLQDDFLSQLFVFRRLLPCRVPCRERGQAARSPREQPPQVPSQDGQLQVAMHPDPQEPAVSCLRSLSRCVFDISLPNQRD